MDYGMYLAASGLMVNQFRQDVAANNIANVNTPAFRPDRVMIQQRLPERQEDDVFAVPPQQLLERLGGGVLADRVRTNTESGRFEETHAPLDLAMDGEGFFALATGRGDGNQRMRFTRDGRFSLDSQGTLVHAGTGMRVLSENNSPIRLRPGSAIEIDGAGNVLQDGRRIARLKLVEPVAPDLMKKAGRNLYQLDNNAQDQLVRSRAAIKQGWIEQSSVEPIDALMAIQSASGAVSNAVRFIQYHDGLTNAAINRFGRVT